MMVMVGSQSVDRSEEEEADAKVTLGLRHCVKRFCLYLRKSGKLVMILRSGYHRQSILKISHGVLGRNNG